MTPREVAFNAGWNAAIQAVIDTVIRPAAERLPRRKATLLIVAEEAAGLMSEQDKQEAA